MMTLTANFKLAMNDLRQLDIIPVRVPRDNGYCENCLLAHVLKRPAGDCADASGAGIEALFWGRCSETGCVNAHGTVRGDAKAVARVIRKRGLHVLINSDDSLDIRGAYR